MSEQRNLLAPVRFGQYWELQASYECLEEPFVCSQGLVTLLRLAAVVLIILVILTIGPR
jgi:hypothetical protein